MLLISLHLVGAEVIVATQVLLAVLDFNLELLRGSRGGNLRVQGLAAVEGAVELLQAAVFGLSFALVALGVGDRHRLLLVDILDWALKRTVTRTLVPWISGQIGLAALDLFLLELGSDGTHVGAKVAADS